jgi:CubicO group peptidase (beta-lactamase class C family)
MSDFQRLTDFLNRLESDFHVKGASVGVLHHGKEVYRGRVGVMDDAGTPVSDSTMFRLYSMTKPVTVVAALQLYEQGAFLMNDEVGKYLPSFWNMTIAKMKDNHTYSWCNVPTQHPIRVRDLFTMTAGLTYGGCYHPAEIATSQAQGRLEQENDWSYTTRQFADMLGEQPLLFEPGEHWNYSYCLDVLGALVEVWSGETFGEYLEEHIFKPLGMVDTTFHLPEEKKSRLTSFWEYNESAGTYRTYTETDRPMYHGKCFESGGAGLISTLDDYLKFAQMLCGLGTSPEGVRILSPATVNLMRTNHLTEVQRKDMDWEVLIGYGYGLGVRTLMDPAAGGSLSHVGEFGWNGMAGTYLLVDPEEELVIVYMQQLYPSMEGRVQPRLRNIVYSCLN